MPVKDNHKTLHRKIACFFASPTLFEAEFKYTEETDHEHGRREVRKLMTSSSLPENYTGFPGVQQVFRLTRQRTIKKTGGKIVESEETVYGMTSLSPEEAKPERLLALLRGHWTIENRSHYVRDVTFGEDGCRVRKGAAPQVLAALRNALISLMRINGCTNIAAARRRFAAQPQQALKIIGCLTAEAE